MDFTTTLKDGSIYNINKYLNVPDDIDIETSLEAVIEWSVEIEAREWGIKSIIPIVTEVAFSINWTAQCEFLNKTEIDLLKKAGGVEMRNGDIEGIINVNPNFMREGDWIILDENLRIMNGQLSIDDIEIDFALKTIEINP